LTDVAAADLTPRAQQTRAAIVETALALFRERGFEAATMREIASRAGVSTGNAYYYFGSKEELIQEFYAITWPPAVPCSPARPSWAPGSAARSAR
jgi:AcrR family transcriptional regulator